MKTFVDKTGQGWELSLTIGAVKRVRDRSGGRFDLLDPQRKVGDRDLFELLDTDLAECWEVVWLLVEPQAAKRDVTAEQFGELMAADCLVDMQAKLFAEWVDFFRQCQRSELAAALTVVAAARAKLLQAAAKHVTAVNVDSVTARMERTIEAKLGESFGNWQASLDSILPT